MINSCLKSKTFWIPTALFLLFLGGFVLLMQTGHVKYYALSRTLSQWDGQHYLSIARDGYQRFPCSYNASYICGNVGWFPFYPLVGWLLSFGGLVNVNWVLLVISWLACWMAVLLLFRTIENSHGTPTASFSVIAMLLYPASFYFLTTFPYSLYLLMAIGVYLMLEKRKFGFLWALSLALSVTYPSVIVIALPIAYTLAVGWKTETARNKALLCLGTVAPTFGLLLYGLYYWVKFGDFFLYQHFQAQGYYAHEISFPLAVIYDTIKFQNTNSPIFLILVFVIATLVLFYTKKVTVGWQIFMFAVLLFTPTFGTADCYYRHAIVAFPMFMMVGYSAKSSWRKLLFPAYIIGALILLWKVFVPMFKLGNLM